jgi:hypothetical protein
LKSFPLHLQFSQVARTILRKNANAMRQIRFRIAFAL